MRRTPTAALALAALAVAALALASISTLAAADDPPKPSASGQRVFELRTYTTHPGKLDALNKRFRDHTCRLFQKHDMELIGFWTPQDEAAGKNDKLVYLLAFPSRDAAKASWEAFRADSEWVKARTESEKDGPIVMKVESVFLDPTDYSRMK
jgi:hypothetical protein